MFQSLLWWIGRVNSAWSWRSRRSCSCFNPCCGGLVASTLMATVHQNGHIGFQSLLWWIGRVNPKDRLVARLKHSPFQSLLWWIGRVNEEVQGLTAEQLAFQSLLWWIGRVNRDDLRHCDPRDRVSILVVVDWSRQREAAQTRAERRRTVSILVVVDWSRQPPTASRTPRQRCCFNPCCGGLVASTSGAAAARRSPPRFQSLLWWIGRVNKPKPKPSPPSAAFQSLLWWIGRVNSTLSNMSDCSPSGFNPCCGGLVASTAVPPDRAAGPRQGFNPCCGGLVASTAGPPMRWRSASRFNPCCGGLVASTRPR